MSHLFPPDPFTEKLCAEQTLAARTRACLLKIEHQGHRAGWNSDESQPTVFGVVAHPEKHYVNARVDRVMTAMLHRSCEQFTGGDVGVALQIVARTMESARDAMVELDVMPANGADLVIATNPDNRFYGFALRVEAWATRGLTDEGRAAVDAKRLHEYEHRIELRSVTLVARDGLNWSLIRERGETPTVTAYRPEGDNSQSGLVPNALGRMTNVVCGNPVPVPVRCIDHPWHREDAQ